MCVFISVCAFVYVRVFVYICMSIDRDTCMHISTLFTFNKYKYKMSYCTEDIKITSFEILKRYHPIIVVVVNSN